MTHYLSSAEADGVEITCKPTFDLPHEIQSKLIPFSFQRFGSDSKWLSAPSVDRLLSNDNLWCIAHQDGHIRASLFVDRQLSDAGMNCTIKSLMSDGSIGGIGKILVSIAATETLRSTSLPVSLLAFLRVLNGEHNVPSMMAFNKAGFFSIVPPARVPIEQHDIHLAADEETQDGCFDVQRLDGQPKQILEQATWLLRHWRPA